MAPLLAGSPAAAADLKGIEVLDTGVLAFSSIREAKDPATGQPISIASGLRIETPTRQIRPAEDLIFGFQGRVLGEPFGTSVTFRIVCHFPNRTSESTTSRYFGEIFLHGCRVRAEDLRGDFNAWAPRIQVFHEDRAVMDERFSVMPAP